MAFLVLLAATARTEVVAADIGKGVVFILDYCGSLDLGRLGGTSGHAALGTAHCSLLASGLDTGR